MDSTLAPPNILPLRTRIWLKFFDLGLDELKLVPKIVAGIGLVLVSIGLVSLLEHRGATVHIIDFVGITMADVTAGVALFMLLERRVVGREVRFIDGRNLRFAVSRISFLLGNVLTYSDPAPGKYSPSKVERLVAELQEMMNDPCQWQFYGAEALHMGVATTVQSWPAEPESFRKCAHKTYSFCLDLNLMPIEARTRQSRFVIATHQMLSKHLKAQGK